MQNFISVVKAVEAAKGAGSKQAKLDAVMELDDMGKTLVAEALSAYRVFGVKKFKMPKTYADVDTVPFEFTTLLDQLHDRDLTGDAAQERITWVLSQYTKETAGYLARILKKDLKWGMSAESVNKAWTGVKRPLEGAVVPVYGCMLAAKFEADKYVWKFPLIAEAKYDGRRNNAFMVEGKLDHKARSGKPSYDLDGLFDEDFAKIERAMGESFVIDGEAMAGSWKESMEAKGSGNDAAKQALKLFAYDIVTLSEWKTEGRDGRDRMTQLQRSEALEAIIKEAGCDKIIKSKWRMVNSIEEANAFYEEVLAEGYEGVMLKDPDAYYEWDRSKAWTKWKPVQDFDGIITGFYKGAEDKEFADTLGGVYIEGTDENGVDFKCKVGSGFATKDKDHTRNRDYIWNNQDEFLGRMIEIEAAPDLNVEEGRDFQTLKFGVFKRYRDDKE